MKIEADAKTMNALVDALGAVVRSLVATLPAAQQKVFLVRLTDAADSAEAKGDILTMALIAELMAAGHGEMRPPESGA